MISADPNDYIQQRVLIVKPCEPPCSGCDPQHPTQQKRGSYTPPTGKLWNCDITDERVVGYYMVVDLDGYSPPDLASNDSDAAHWSLWPSCDCCGLSEPQMNWIRQRHPGMHLHPWGEPQRPKELAR